MDNKNKPDPLKQSLWGKIFQRLILWTVYFLFRPKVIWEDEQTKRLLKGRAAVFVCNHTHHFDGAFAGAVLDRFKPYVLVKKNWYEKKKVGTMISWCRCLPIDLDVADAEWFVTGERIVKNNGSMIIFPEGGIARDGKMGEFKAGAALLAASTGTDIVPAAIYGTYDMVFGMRQKILIGKPISGVCPEDMRHSKFARQLSSQAQAEVKRLYAKLEAQYGNCGTYSAEEAEIK